MVTARLRLPFFLLALLAIALVVLVERGSDRVNQVAGTLMPFLRQGASMVSRVDQAREDLQFFSSKQAAELNNKLKDPDNQDSLNKMALSKVGYAIPSMQYVDGILLFTILLMGLALLIPPKTHAKVQGAITLVFAVALIIAAIAWIFTVLAKLIPMVALLFSFPFGTLVYLVVYGHFPRSEGYAVLGLLFTLRIFFGALLLLAHEGFIKQIGLVIFVVVAFVAGLVVSFLYGVVPGILVSITDAIGAIVVAIIAIVLGLVLAIGSIPSILKVVKI